MTGFPVISTTETFLWYNNFFGAYTALGVLNKYEHKFWQKHYELKVKYHHKN